MSEIRFLAYYLPQYHPIPENDEWWGKGFTEWTNVAKAKPLFRRHKQPKLPADFGFYDLRLPEIQEKQSELALDYGIDGFIYYQYWFGGDKYLLERPAEQMLENKKVKIPFCFCWANETWKGIWHGVESPDILIEQEYGEDLDYRQYFDYLLPFFKDERYIKVGNKPMFHIYRIDDIPNLEHFLELFNFWAIQEGFNGVYFVATIVNNIDFIKSNEFIFGQVGIDIFRRMRYNQDTWFKNGSFLNRIEMKYKSLIGYTNKIGERRRPLIFDYKKGVKLLSQDIPHKKYIPCAFPNWDNSPRSGKKSLIFKNATPNAWKEHLDHMIRILKSKPENPQIIIIKSWNEWAEGNYLEPDQEFGISFLKVIKELKLTQKN
ncbi:glycoside hydrolase family 99-like domain-containing protein [Leeuwenhoekiella aestuarii]|uniref:glycosyltransferase WbsX family protein n=1 Tax=Leeuwenhoekiella aestuarii TaxID=2249426 RepID=UPI001375C5EE|nr:glycoside hydrolase family 99-like domain-containing protein [Leeuwenhoekiella aestuarii]